MQVPPYPVEGTPISAAWGRMVSDCLRSLLPRGGLGIRVNRTPSGTIVSTAPKTPTGGSAHFSGTVYLAGVKHTGLDSDPDKPWVVVDIASGTVTESASTPPDPLPDHQEWYEKTNTYGDIHVVRA